MKQKQFRICLCLWLAWTLFIFCRSLKTAELSGQESLWVLQWLYRVFPFRPTDGQIRKMAHFTEFAVLGVLIACTFRQKRLTPRHVLPLALSAGGATALVDETIQLFVEGRSGQIQDVWIDIGGTAAGVLFLALLRFLWRSIHHS